MNELPTAHDLLVFPTASTRVDYFIESAQEVITTEGFAIGLHELTLIERGQYGIPARWIVRTDANGRRY